MENLKDIIRISDYSRICKHKQIVDCVLSAARTGSLQYTDKLPSVNEMAFDYNVSRDTVVRAYAFLKENNIIESIPGKGYYLKSGYEEEKVRLFLLVNRLDLYQKKIFDALSFILSESGMIDFYVYQDDYHQFKKHILKSRSKEYTHYVLNVSFYENGDEVREFIKNEIPLNKLILLDKKIDKLENVACVYQDFEKDIYAALNVLSPLLTKYASIKLVFPKIPTIPIGIKRGFLKFSGEWGYKFDIVENIVDERPERNAVYICTEENDLIELIKQIQEENLAIGKDVGIISYNDSSLKEILLGGITVISADFEKIGEQTGLMILNNKKEQIRSSFNVMIRSSL